MGTRFSKIYIRINTELNIFSKSSFFYLLFISIIVSGNCLYAQKNFRPATASGSDHSWFKNGKINIINSSHQDIAWMDSIGACEIWRDVNMITPSLQIMESNPNFCFTVENAMYLEEYLKRHPDKYDEILKYTKEGRLEWGATYNQPYESMYDGEALIRQTYLEEKC